MRREKVRIWNHQMVICKINKVIMRLLILGLTLKFIPERFNFWLSLSRYYCNGLSKIHRVLQFYEILPLISVFLWNNALKNVVWLKKKLNNVFSMCTGFCTNKMLTDKLCCTHTRNLQMLWIDPIPTKLTQNIFQ